jgi:hypothetical protein
VYTPVVYIYLRLSRKKIISLYLDIVKSPEYTESCQPSYGGNVFSQAVEDTGGEKNCQVGEGVDKGEE